LILSDELARIGSSGVGAVLTLGPSIALPPIIYFGTKEQKEKIIKPILSGDKTICLAITGTFITELYFRALCWFRRGKYPSYSCSIKR